MEMEKNSGSSTPDGGFPVQVWFTEYGFDIHVPRVHPFFAIHEYGTACT
jgi:hypothetical protein